MEKLFQKMKNKLKNLNILKKNGIKIKESNQIIKTTKIKNKEMVSIINKIKIRKEREMQVLRSYHKNSLKI